MRTQVGNKCYIGLTKLFRSRSISRIIKFQIYQASCVVRHGSETWTLRKKDENALLVLEKKVPRKMYEPYKDKSAG